MNTEFLLTLGGTQESIALSEYLDDSNGNNQWDIGEQLVYPTGDITGLQVEATVVDVSSNSVVMMGVLQEGETIVIPSLVTSVDTINPYIQTSSSLIITATGDSELDNVTLYYSWSENNVTWFALPPIGDITDAVVSTYEWDQQEGLYPDVCRVNNSEFYLIAACGDSGTDHDGWAKTIRVYDDNGTIRQFVISSYEYDNTEGYYPSVVHLSGTDKYAIAYRDTTGDRVTVVTLQVSDTTGAITQSVIDSQILTYDGLYTNMILVSPVDPNRLGWILAIAYQEGGTGGVPSTGDGFMETIWINKTGTINNTVLSTREFDTADCLYPRLLMVDGGTIAVCYTTTSSDGYVSTWNITSAGVISAIRADSWEYDTSNGQYPGFIKIDGNIFAVAYRDTDTHGCVKTFTIADTGMITKSFIDTLTFTGTMVNLYNYIFPVISGSVYGISFQGLSADGYIYTMNISNDGTIGDAIIDSIEFDTANNAFTAPVVYVNNSYFLVVYQGSGNDGWSCTVEINTDKSWMEWNDANNPDTTYPWRWNFNFPNETGYYEFYSIGKYAGTVESAPANADSICRYT
jgi:hypothetical protein